MTKRKRTIVLLVSTVLLGGAAFGTWKWWESWTDITGAYWMTVVKDGERVPLTWNFGKTDETRHVCCLGPDEDGGMLFIIPHPCNTMSQPVTADAWGFASVSRPGYPAVMSLTARRRWDGVFTVKQPGTRATMAMRKISKSELRAEQKKG